MYKTLPCRDDNACPYEYNLNPERDVEGMPFVDDDPRGCPNYGHICPEYMEDFDLTAEDLKIRALIHCYSAATNMVEAGQLRKRSLRYLVLQLEFRRVARKYPQDKYPHYYRSVWNDARG